MGFKKSLVIPCKDEGEDFKTILQGFKANVSNETEIIVVLDSFTDPTYKAIEKDLHENSRVKISNNSGPAAAVKAGIDDARGQYICIAMGDGSDQPKDVEKLFSLIDKGADIAVGSRYSKGGNYIGEKNLKWFLSRAAGFILYHFFRVGTKDSTNMFKAYSKNFLNQVTIESDNGFTLGLEMVIKAKLNKNVVKEIPTVWTDRTFGSSKFNLKKFFPSYIYWVRRLILRKV
jgi:dolichol-phosphate mannosyltransferase